MGLVRYKGGKKKGDREEKKGLSSRGQRKDG